MIVPYFFFFFCSCVFCGFFSFVDGACAIFWPPFGSPSPSPSSFLEALSASFLDLFVFWPLFGRVFFSNLFFRSRSWASSLRFPCGFFFSNGFLDFSRLPCFEFSSRFTPTYFEMLSSRSFLVRPSPFLRPVLLSFSPFPVRVSQVFRGFFFPYFRSQ